MRDDHADTAVFRRLPAHDVAPAHDLAPAHDVPTAALPPVPPAWDVWPPPRGDGPAGDGPPAGDGSTRPGRSRRRWIVAVVAVAVVALTGGVVAATFLGPDVTAGQGSSAAPAAGAGVTAPPTGPAAPAAPGGPSGSAGRAARATRGTIVTQTGGTWTVRTARGRTETVVVGQGTRFGTPARPATAGSFSTGERVLVVGPVAGGRIVATRIVATGAPAGT